jgi:ParB family chromosome partitioning protein
VIVYRRIKGEETAMAAGAQKTRLGRGLASLIGDRMDEAGIGAEEDLRRVPLAALKPSRFNPRRNFAEAQLEELAASIRERGLVQPLIVRPSIGDTYEIVAGERRWRAAQMAKIHEIPVVIREFTDAQALEAAIVENVQRQDLSPIEEAKGYQRLIEEFKHTQEGVAQVLGKSRSHIANTVRLLSLPEAVQALLGSGEISAGHARALIGAADPEALARRVVAEGLTVRQTERLARGEGEPAAAGGKTGRAGEKKPAPPKDPDTVALERDLTALLGLRVTIEFRGQGGSLTVHYQTLEQLDDVLHRLNQMPPGAPQEV